MAVNSGKIFIRKSDINLRLMLEGGQSFRWKSCGLNEWMGVFKGVAWKLIQFEDHINFTAHTEIHFKKDTCSYYEKLLRDYLRIDSPLDKYYKDWSEKDGNFKEAAQKFNGLRMLQQEPVENLFSFICSSNNNIIRISMMVNKMCELYGDKICSINSETYYSFPDVDKLTHSSVESALRTAGFGYRAKFISSSAQTLSKLGGASYLDSLKKLPYSDAKKELLQFQGIGPKVADCICLMSLNHFEAVPVDTHVFQVATLHYLPHLKSVKSVTDRVYKEIADFFRELYGPLAGWAHTILFCADLKKFQSSNEKTIKMIASNSKRKATKRKSDGEK